MGAVVPISQATRAQRRAIVDEFGCLQEELRPKQARLVELRETILGWYKDHPADEAFAEVGKSYALDISARSKERVIFDMAALFRKLGRQLFLQLCKIPLAAVDAAVGKEQHSEFIREEQTGSRTIKAGKIQPLPVAQPTRRAA